ncbi:MAG: Rpn family recombination-promoting nuclease/putative transposase [Tannerella sp.]|jgi:hypothetical protein|nr:Rpn family recombination-promoting nuclease/putative transposase [Tannerella sp.]
MARYLDPKNDLIFKRIFGENPNLRKRFLSALMPLKADRQIESLEYLPSEQTPDNPARRNLIVDDRDTDEVIEGLEFVLVYRQIREKGQFLEICSGGGFLITEFLSIKNM